MIPLADCKNFPFLYKLALKHRQGKNHKMRIIAFVGSPVEDNEKDVSPGDSWGMWQWGLLGLRRALGIMFIILGEGGCAEFSVSVGGLGEVNRFLYAFVRCVISPHGMEQISSFIFPLPSW